MKLTSGDSPCTLASGTCDAVPACELHIGELGHIAPLPILARCAVVLRRRHQAILALVTACLLGQVGEGFPHGHA